MHKKKVYILMVSLGILLFNSRLASQNAPVTRLPVIGNLIPNQEIVVPLVVTGFNNIGSCSLTCEYDYSKIQYVSTEINPSLTATGSYAVGDNDRGNGIHRLILGWYGIGTSLPEGAWLVKFKFKYLSGTGSIKWIDNGASCAYTNNEAVFLNDSPTSQYYIDGFLCGSVPPAGVISGPVTVMQGTSDVKYSITPLQDVTGYTWSLPSGAIIDNPVDSSSIQVDFSTSAQSGIISVKGTNSCVSGSSSTLSVTLTPGTTGTDIFQDKENKNKHPEIVIYPNPADQWFIVRWDKPVNDYLILYVYSSNGKLLKNFIIRYSNFETQFIIPVNDLEPGIYFLHFKYGLKQTLKKLIIN